MFGEEKSYNSTLYLRIWAGIFGALGLLAALFTGFSLFLLYAALASLVIALPIYLIVSWLGDSAGNIFFGLGSKISSREQMAGELDKARHLLRQKKYSMGLSVVVAVLEIEPDFDDALLIKAECEMRAGDIKSAKETLMHLFRVCKPGEPKRRWAANMFKEVQQFQDTDTVDSQ